MRRLCLIASVLAALATPAAADSFVDFVGGIASPLDDSTWTNLVDTSAKLGARAGVLDGQFGGMLSADWTPENLNAKSGTFPGGSADLSGHRFRILVQALAQQHVAPKITIVERAGAGLDIAHGSYSVTVLGATNGRSDTDLGVGFELGAGVWIAVTDSVSLGGELAIPIGYHSHKAENTGDIAFDYTSTDLDLMFGVRLWQR